MQRMRIRRIYTLGMIVMLILSNLSYMFLWEGTESVEGENPLTPISTINGSDEGDNFAKSVSWAGDVNGDGYDDMIVGAPYTDSNISAGSGDWWSMNWSYRKILTFNNSEQSEDLVNFPVLVNLSSSNFNYSKAKPDGTDLRFIDADGGTELKYHIEDWNSSCESYVWVNVTNIDAGSSSDHIWMYYGNSDAADIQDESGTYDSDFMMVQHLNETSGIHYDSTQYGNDGTEYIDAPGTQDAFGKIDGADEFDGSDDLIDCGNDASVIFSGKITAEAWVKFESWNNSDYNVIVTRSNGGDEWMLTQDWANLCFKIYNNWVPQSVAQYPMSNLNIGEWYHIVGTYDVSGDARARLYVNGNNIATGSADTDYDVEPAHPLTIGEMSGQGGYFNGTIDEVRISNTTRSTGWIKAQYLSMNNDFITYGTEEIIGMDAGAAYIFFGHPQFNSSKVNASDANVTIYGSNAHDLLGWSVGGAGNLNGDGYGDIIIGAPGWGYDRGRVYIFYGKTTAAWSSVYDADSDADMCITGENVGDRFGSSVSGAGNVDGSGYDDIIVGAPYNDGDSWWNSNWAYRNKLTFDNSGQTEDLKNFPVLIKLTPWNFDYSKVKSDGSDLRFIDADDRTKLNYHIEDWNPLGNSHIWVNVTNIDAGSSTDYIWMYYCNFDASDVQDECGTFDSNYVMVQHLDESPDDDVEGHYDCTSNNNDGTPKNFTDGGGGSTNAAGKIDGADDFDGIDDHLNAGNDASLDIIGTEITMEAWVYGEFPTQYTRYNVINKYNRGTGGFGLIVYRHADNMGAASAYLQNGSTWSETLCGNKYVINPNTWHHVVFTWESPNGSLYIDGVKRADCNFGGSINPNPTKNLWIGRPGGASGTDVYWNGTIDEVRISNTARSADWIRAQYLSMNNEFITYGGEGPGVWWNSDWSYRKKLIFNNSEQSGNLVNFPVLINLSSSNFDYSKAKSDGTDLRFIDADGGTELKYHIEHWNSSKNSYVWVNVTNIDAASSNDYIWMYYGNSGASDAQDESGTYDSDYVMVQHLNETSGIHYDSTQYGNDGTEYIDAPGTQNALGKIDGADYFDGNGDYIDCGNDSSLDFNDSFSVEAWFLYDGPGPTGKIYHSLLNKNPTGMGQNDTYHTYVANDTKFFMARVGNGSVSIYLNSNMNVSDGKYHYGVLVFDDPADRYYLYLDGLLKDTWSVSSSWQPVSNNGGLTIGVWDSYNDYYNGTIDEVKISKTARSSDWISAHYLCMKNSFITYSEEETRGWWNSDWSYRRKLAFDNSGQSEDLINFPVLINLSASNFDYSKAKLDGTDLRFIDTDGSTELKYHIEHWNPAGESYVWVNVTSITAHSNTDSIWMYYGNSEAFDVQNESGTYDANYVMVQHLDETPDDDVQYHYDSTNYGNNGTPKNFQDGGNGTTDASGKIDGADDFHGDDDYIDVGNDTSLNFTDAITIEAWMRPSQYDRAQGLVTKGYLYTTKHGIALVFYSNNKFRFILGNGADIVVINSDTIKEIGRWYHVVAVFTGSGVKMYVDGIKQVEEISISAPIEYEVDKNVYLGGYTYGYLNGTMDEIRISNTARSSDWIWAQYLSMSNRFITYCKEETEGWWNSHWSYRRKLTFDNSGQSEDLINFPVLINLSESNFDYSKAKSDGTDLRFIDADSVTNLKYHIEDWNSTGESFVWVNVTNIDAASSSDYIWMYYGNSDASDIQDESGTYDDNFVMVQHLDESPDDDVKGHYDSTRYHNDGVPRNFQDGGNGSTNATGKMDGTDYFDGVDDYIDCGNDSSLNLTDEITVEFWWKPRFTMNSSFNRYIMYIDKSSDHVNNGYGVSFRHDSGKISGYVWNGSSMNCYTNKNNWSANTWHYIAYTVSSSSRNIYVNGILETTRGGVIPIGTSANLYISTTSLPINGTIDEVRISNRARSSDWISAQHLSMNNSFIIFGDEETKEWWHSNWQFRKKLTFDNSGQSETLLNFPILVKLSPSNFDYSKAKSDGTDLRFIDIDDTTELKYHIEDWNPTGESFVWVNVTNIDAASSADYIWMYYGNSIASDVQDEAGTYDSNYMMVQHLDEGPDDDVKGHYDSTRYHNDGIPRNFQDGGNGSTNATGKMDGTDYFDGVDDYIDCGSGSSLQIGEKNITITAWIKSTEYTEGYVTIVDKYDYVSFPSGDSDGFRLFLDSGKLRVYLGDGNSPNGCTDADGPDLRDNEWHYVGVTYNGTDEIIWLDGEVTESQQLSITLSPATRNCYIGQIGEISSWRWNGSIDEVRISNKARSADWIRAQYLCMNNSFITYSSEDVEVTKDRGRAYIFYGDGSIPTQANCADVILTGEATNDLFGFSVSKAGDVNNDSYDDIIVGAPGYSFDKGRAYIFYGDDGIASEIPAIHADVTLTGENAGDRFGWSVANLNDINQDGSYDDVIVGAPNYDGLNWWNDSWSYRKRLTFDNSDQSEDLVNFPVLVNLSSWNFNYSKAKSDGLDLRFIDADGTTELNYQIEDWNPSSSSYIWVNVKKIARSSLTDYIWMYYGNSDASDAQDESGTYDDNYVMVQHLDEKSGIHYDSTQYGNNGTEYIDAPGTQDTTGNIDGADDFDGNDDYINCGNDTSLSIAKEITIEAWVKTNTNTSTQIVVEKRIMGIGTYNLKIINNRLNIYIEEIDSGTSGFRYLSDNSWIGDGQWHHIVGTASLVTDEIHMYLDGTLDDGSTNPINDITDFSCEANLTIGRRSTGSDYFNGTIDEVRISNMARRADWIRAQYLSMNNSFLTYGSEEIKDWWDSDWSFRKKLTFDNSGQSEDLVNFPVLINFNPSNFNYLKAKSDGTDLRFIDADGVTNLKYHIEDWNSAGESFVWVNVTNIAAGMSTDYIWMYYGNLAALDVQDESGTYDSNYVMVQHLNETSGIHYDSTQYDNDGTDYIDFPGTQDSIGKVDGADHFDGDGDYVECGNDSSLDITGPITIEAWIKPAMFHEDGLNYGVMAKAQGTPFRWSWQLRFGRESAPTNSLGFQFHTDLEHKWVHVHENLTPGNWYYVVGVFNGSEAMMYLNGIQKDNTSFNSINSSSAPLYIGQEGWDQWFNGTIDEVRISNTARSVDWIFAQYLCMENNFITVGGEETRGWWNSDWKYRKKLTFDNSGQSEALINFPVLIDLSPLNFDYSKAKHDGTDLRFIDSDGGTELKYHIEDWDLSGNSYIWVNVTNIAAGSLTDHIWMYYGNSVASDVQDEAGTYDANYMMVQHLSESPDDGVQGHYDSTSNSNDGIPSNFQDGGVGSTNATGRIDGADYFDGVNDHVDCGNDSSLNITDAITIEAWVYGYNYTGFNRAVYKPSSFLFRPTDGSFNSYLFIDGAIKNFETNVPIDTEEWLHLTFTYDSVTRTGKKYLNGDLRSEKILSGLSTYIINSSMSSVFIGGPTQAFNGTIDEVRISNIARSSDWIKAQYLCMNNSFITYGGEETKNRGRAYIFFGESSLKSSIDASKANVTLTGENNGDGFGFSVSTAGDINGDGAPDVIVGTPYYDDGIISDSGAVYIFEGGALMDSTVDWIYTGEQAGDHFGFSVSYTGDMNRDGLTDITVGAPDNGDGGANAGKAYLLSGTFKPVITYIAVTPSTKYIGGYVNITCNVSAPTGINSVQINITLPGGGFINENMTHDTGEIWFYNTTYFSPGIYQFSIWANETFGSWIESGIFQFEVLNRAPVLSQDKVDPDTGYIDTWFNFTVNYTDLDNHAPNVITLNITGVGVYNLSEVDSLDLDYTDGKEYYYNLSGLDVGQHNFHFAANDTLGNWDESLSSAFEVVNRNPILTQDQVDPITGSIDSWFNFTVIYTDLDNHDPNTITLNISGIGVYNLDEVDSLDLDYTNGKEYYYNLSGFDIGQYYFHFAANDTLGNWTETLPSVFDVLNRAPILSQDKVDPSSGAIDIWFNFTVNYTDLDNHAPDIITLNITGGGVYNLSEVDLLDLDYTDGKDYYYNLTGFGVGQYPFHFAANDSLGLWGMETTGIENLNVTSKYGYLDIDDCIGDYSDEIHFIATLLDNESNPIPGITVNFYIDENKNGIYTSGEFIGSGTTLLDGSVSVYYTVYLTPDTYDFSVTYDGSGNYSIVGDEALLIINKKQATLTAISDTAEEKEETFLTAILLDDDGDPIAGEQVAFYIDKMKNGIYESGDFIGFGITLTNGVASINYDVDLVSQFYNIWAEYKGSASYDVSEIEGLLTVQNTDNDPPKIKQPIPNQIKPEDSPPWALDLTIYEEDDRDSGPDLKWYITGVDTTLYSVTGSNSSDDVFTFIPKKNAYGNDEVVLWLVDSSGAKVSQVLWINITPVNDPPYFEPLPPNIDVHFDDPSTSEDDPTPWDYTFYVHDVESPIENLFITTSEPRVDSGEGHVEIHGLNVSFHYPEDRVDDSIPVILTLSDGIDTAQTVIVVSVTTNWVPEKVDEIPDVILEENSTLYYHFDLDDYFFDRDHNSLFFSSGYFHVGVNINENNTVDITAFGQWTGSEFITFRAEDPSGAMVEDTIRVTVIPVNDPPSISGVPDLVVHYDLEYGFDLSPYIYDPDTKASELIIWTSESTDYIWLHQYNELGIVIKYPESMNGTTIPVTINVSDGYVTVSQQIQVTVTEDFPPHLTNKLPDVFFDEDTFLENVFILSEYFNDTDSEVLYYTNGTKFINVTINYNLTVDFTAPENWYGSEFVTFRATDPWGALAEDKILVVVVPVNDPPIIKTIPKQEKFEGDEWILDIFRYISDVDNNASELIVTMDSKNGTGYVTLVGNILVFQYPEGVYDDIITIAVSDGEHVTNMSFEVSIERSKSVAPSIWNLIPWHWVFLFFVVAFGGAFAFYRKKSRYWVYEAFLIHENGLPIAHASREESSDLEDVVVSGMFTAVQNFINDAFSDKKSDEDWELDEMTFGDNKILIERSQDLFLAVIFEGYGGKLRKRVRKLLKDINRGWGEIFKDWDGEMEKLKDIRTMIASLITKKESKQPKSEQSIPDKEEQWKEFGEAMMGTGDEKEAVDESLEELLESIDEAYLEYTEASPEADTEVEEVEVEVFECPVCGKEVEEEAVKCPICGVEFMEIDELQSPSPQKPEIDGLEKSLKEDENPED